MTLKATIHDEISDGIIISFYSKWEPLLASGAVHCVFRKRGPRKMIPRWIYVYAGIPIKAIVGRLLVEKIEVLSIEESMRHLTKGAITEEEFSRYAAGYKELFVFTVANYQAAKKAADLENLKNRYGYSPPQSFLVLSKEGKRRIDELCGF